MKEWALAHGNCTVKTKLATNVPVHVLIGKFKYYAVKAVGKCEFNTFKIPIWNRVAFEL